MTTTLPDIPIRCVQTGGLSGPIRQGRFTTKVAVFPGGHLAFVIEGRPVVGAMLPGYPRKAGPHPDPAAAAKVRT
ncbi:hypothetical protein [Limimaricola hongkongensis]|uniref:Uncharacterized protein n=1 Tax=Limimaricola hongkongensis DSM 17492 TaxID=1122180 RepID=A0A017HBT9_9RHOB|nr:hypothetical protein [Limimaricola hongkongensis]EYD71780.1 hypothetical protein Lokhon_01850 [Limimaricola hongkongensis DSM 17492]